MKTFIYPTDHVSIKAFIKPDEPNSELLFPDRSLKSAEIFFHAYVIKARTLGEAIDVFRKMSEVVTGLQNNFDMNRIIEL